MTALLDTIQRRGMVWFSSRQRVIVLDFADEEEARAWDALSDEEIVNRLRGDTLLRVTQEERKNTCSPPIDST